MSDVDAASSGDVSVLLGAVPGGCAHRGVTRAGGVFMAIELNNVEVGRTMNLESLTDEELSQLRKAATTESERWALQAEAVRRATWLKRVFRGVKVNGA